MNWGARGVAHSHKNELGQVAAMSILLWQVKACLEKVDFKLLLFVILFSFYAGDE
jgi:hypothetical protein